MKKSANSALVPYRTRGGVLEFYLQRRSMDAPKLPGFLGFFGGGLEPGETPEQAMLREILEELVLVPVGYTYVGCYEHASCFQHIFLIEAGDNFEKDTMVMEGDYGLFMEAGAILADPTTAPSTAVVITDLITKLKPGN